MISPLRDEQQTAQFLTTAASDGKPTAGAAGAAGAAAATAGTAAGAVAGTAAGAAGGPAAGAMATAAGAAAGAATALLRSCSTVKVLPHKMVWDCPTTGSSSTGPSSWVRIRFGELSPWSGRRLLEPISALLDDLL